MAPYTPGVNSDGSSGAEAALSTYEKVVWQITVDGQPIRRLLHFSLHQSVGAHHRFELRLYHTELEDARAYRIDRTRDLIGKTLTATLGTHHQPDVTRFAGIITEVALEEKTGLYSEIVLRGASPTILLDGEPHLTSYYFRTLESIASDTLQPFEGSALCSSIQPRHTASIEYTVQHQESRFLFLARLAALHGEWFYYDGEALQFGRPSRLPEHTLQYARHIERLQMKMQAVPMASEHLGYRAENHQSLTAPATGSVAGLNFYGDAAVAHSDKLWGTAETRRFPTRHAPDAGELDRGARTQRAAAAAGAFWIEGSSRHPAPRPGLRLGVTMGSDELGQYLITEAVHTLDNVSHYSCTFRGIGADIETLPICAALAAVPLRRSDAQLATVTHNEDPAGQGRVRVQFPWQRGDNLSPWIRVLSPDAGGTGAVEKNRGFVFIPEAGDQVLVDFLHGDPDQPFVAGSLYHGANTSAQGGGANSIKTLSTRSGNTVTLNDADGSVTVEDAGGSVYRMDGQGNVELTAPKTVTVNGTDIHLNATNNVSLTAGNHLLANAMVQMLMTTPHLQQFVADYMHLQTAKALLSATEGDITVEARNTIVAGQERIFLHSDEQVVANSRGKLELKGEEGSNHSNVADTHEPARPEVTAKCMVKFRPSDTWAGEYGFDWLREGDTGRPGDQWFGRIMGKHWVGGAVQPDGNSYQGTFRVDRAMYDRKLRSYRCLSIGWKRARDGRPYLYPIPSLTLMPDASATLNLKIEIEEVPERLTLEWEDSAASSALTVNLTSIGDIRRGRYEKHDYLRISCTRAFSQPQTLWVKADGQICGGIKIHPNAPAFISRPRVAFINVQTAINGRVITGQPNGGAIAFFRQSFRQALTDPQLQHTVLLNATGRTHTAEFRRRFCVRAPNGVYSIKADANTEQLRDFLEGALRGQYGARFNSHYRMYFVGEQYPRLNGYAYPNSRFGAYFPSHASATVPHEMMHAMGLPHTFDGVDSAARFTYKGKSTDNILDYSHHNTPPTPRVSLFRWQWKLLNPNLR